MITIYHNPRCSKSRAALEFVEEYAEQNDLTLHVIEYLKTPLSAKELIALQKQLGSQASEMVRDHDNLTPAQQREILLAQPELLQRPIVSYLGSAVIGRPTELIHTLLGA
jgi:arsenate reductase